MLTELFAVNLDSFGLITKAGDGGDTCSRHFCALYCLPHSQLEAKHALTLLQLNGIPRRHPDESKWYSSTDRTSRDQLIPYLCYTATYAPQAFKALAVAHSKHLFMFAWNTRRNFQYSTLEAHQRLSTPDVAWNYAWKMPDICGPNIWAIYLRAFATHSLTGKALLPIIYPLLHVLDLQQFIACIGLAFSHYILGHEFGRTSNSNALDHDCQNSTLMNHYSATHHATIFSKITWLLFMPMGRKAARSFFTQDEEPRLDIAIETLT